MNTPRRHRPHVYYDQATTVCATCMRRIEAKIVFRDERVLMQKWCPEHGHDEVVLADDINYWRASRELWLRPGEIPHRFQTTMTWGCPYDCGICPDHQQHACVAIVEITEHCNLSCPVCFAESGPHRPGFVALSEIEAMLDAVVHAEQTPDVVQISGGEPTIHPEFFAVLDAARQRPIRHLMVNTNGIRIGTDPAFVERLASHMPAFEVYLQFDAIDDEANLKLRGARLHKVRLQALEALEKHGISTTLVATVAAGVNDEQLGAIIELATRYRCVRGVTFQPIEQAGRTAGLDAANARIPLTAVRRKIGEQSSIFSADDLVPVPCHPDTLAMAYGIRQGSTITPLTRSIPREALLDAASNTIRMEATPGLREAFQACLSTGLGPEQAAGKLQTLLCCLPELDVGPLSYENVFRLLIVRFPDVHDFDVRSAKKSCIFFARPDGRLIPFETYNIFYRDPARSSLGALRAEVATRVPRRTQIAPR